MDAPITYDAYLEVDQSGRWQASILDLTGCFAYGASEAEALAALVAAIPGYYAWLKAHDDYTPDVHGPWQVTPRETFRTIMVGGNEVRAFFAPDAQPVDDEELDWGLALLQWAVEDLAALLRGQPESALDRPPPAGGWSMRKVLEHLTNEQFWYVTRLDNSPGAPPIAANAGASLAQLQQIAAACVSRLRGASDAQRVAVTELQGERWSLRKIIRRSVWHVRDHTAQIRQLLR